MITQFAPGFMFSLFSRDAGSLHDLGILTLRIVTCTFPFIAIQMMGGQFFQAIGKPVQAAVLSLSRQILFFIPALLLLPVLFGNLGLPPIYGVYAVFPVSDFCSAIISGTFVLGEFRKWKKLKPAKEG